MRKLVIVLVVLAVAAACGGDDDEDDSGPALETPAATTSPSPPEATSTPAVATPLPESEVTYNFYPEPEQPWHKVPSIAVLAAPGDPRIEMLREGVAYWNSQFEEIGVPFRLGEITHSTSEAPTDAILRLSERFSDQEAFDEIVRGHSEDIVVVMSDVDMPFSFTTPLQAPRRRRSVVVIRDDAVTPMSDPDIARQVIAHELGHSIGLGHNDDPARMMCGRPADCPLERLSSTPGRFLTLTEGEIEYLRRIYPSD